MRRGFLLTFMLVLGVALGILLAGCGGATKTVTVASTPLPEQTTTAPRTSTTTTRATAPTTTTPGPSENGGTSGPTTTRTAPEPAFTHQGSTAEGLSGAEAVLQARGFTANATSDYHAKQTLRVLIGTHTGSAGEGGQQAFFFVGGHYLGTDSKQPSASIHVVSQGDTEVTLAYSLSSARQATVRFQLNNGKLTPLDPIPPASSRQ
jgi:LppP/LprE lipoprotein